MAANQPVDANSDKQKFGEPYLLSVTEEIFCIRDHVPKTGDGQVVISVTLTHLASRTYYVMTQTQHPGS
jgi:hypothetical protein